MDLNQMGSVISRNFDKMNQIGTVISSNFNKMTNKGLVEQVREFGFLGRVRQSIHLNKKYLKGFNDSIAYLNRFQDLKSYELSTMDYLDKLVSKESKTFNCLPDQHFLKSLLRENTNLYYQIKCKYYNPKTKSMVDFIPITELDPIISYNYYYSSYSGCGVLIELKRLILLRKTIRVRDEYPCRSIGIGKLVKDRRGNDKFPEFDGTKLDVTNRNEWPTVCMYVLKEEQKPGKHLIRNSNYCSKLIGFVKLKTQIGTSIGAN